MSRMNDLLKCPVITNRKRVLLMFLVSLVITACSTLTLDSDAQKTPTSEHGTHTKHGSFYDFVWSEPPAEKCAQGKGLARVRYHTNIVYVLVSVVSLGLYVPQTVEWWCDGSTDSDDEEEFIPE